MKSKLRINMDYVMVSRKWGTTTVRKWRKSKVTSLILVVLLPVYLCTFYCPSASAIMTFPEKGVYSLFPHEDLRTGKRLRFEYDSSGGDKYVDRGRDDIVPYHPHHPDHPNSPSQEPFVIDILRPTTYPTSAAGDPSLRKLTNSFESFHRERDRLPYIYRQDNVNYDRYNNINNRSPRVYFDDERRVYGYGKKYPYHDEYPPGVSSSEDRLRDISRETNLIRPSPVDYTDRPNYRYLPEAKLPPRSRDKDDDDGNPPARIHLFTPHNADKFGSSRNNNGQKVQPDGPVLVDAPGPGAFLNHEEYLNFHTKIALDTLELEKKKLEDTRRKILFSPSPRPQLTNNNDGLPGDGLVPPNFSKEVTVIEESVENGSDERRPGGSSSSRESGEEEDENNIGTTTTSSSTGGTGNNNNNGSRGSWDNKNKLNTSTFSTRDGENDKTTKFKGGESVTPPRPSLESGFLPVIPFQLRGQEHTKPSVVPLTPDPSQNISKSSFNLTNYPSTVMVGNIYKDKEKEKEFNLPSPSSLSSVGPTNFNIPLTPSSSRAPHVTSYNYEPSSSSSSKQQLSSEESIGFSSSSKRRPSGTNPPSSTFVTKHSSSSPPDKKIKVPSVPVTPTSSSITTVKTSTTTTTTRVGSSVSNPTSSSSSSEKSSSGGGKRKISSISSIPPTHSKATRAPSSTTQKQQQSVFVDSSEVPSSFNLSLAAPFHQSQSPPSPLHEHDKMMIYVQRVKNSIPSAGGRKRQPQQTVAGSTGIFSTGSGKTRYKIESTVSVHESQSLNEAGVEEEDNRSNPSLEFYPVKYNESDFGTTSGPGDHIIATTGNGINSGVVAHVKARISSCPKLYGSVEIICDVHIRDRHGHPNPQLIVGWLRKYYNETKEDKVLAVNKTLAYEEDFHDKFNVTLAPGIAPMLRSVLLIRSVLAADCGIYQCNVFDGVSIHKSETLLFLCH